MRQNATAAGFNVCALSNEYIDSMETELSICRLYFYFPEARGQLVRRYPSDTLSMFYSSSSSSKIVYLSVTSQIYELCSF